ncbi:hypothetical protein IPF89_02490 [Candidatus Saccharibacteria bacterium]|jgi:hypothetical protein|nr:MAG: hypothetical protein IPF89_02490 [Candidatus Saccharibacteria bacterium]
MYSITKFEQADARARELVPTRDNIEATVASEPKIYDSKKFWVITYRKADTKDPVIVRGSIAYIADNGKLIRFSSNPLITPFDDHEKLLVAAYDD